MFPSRENNCLFPVRRIFPVLFFHFPSKISSSIFSFNSHIFPSKSAFRNIIAKMIKQHVRSWYFSRFKSAILTQWLLQARVYQIFIFCFMAPPSSIARILYVQITLTQLISDLYSNLLCRMFKTSWTYS